MENTEQFWETRWQNNETGWDLRVASPSLVAYAAQIPPEDRTLAVLIPGCGNGYEAIALLEMDYSDITMLDIAPTAVEKLRDRVAPAYPEWEQVLQLICDDFFHHEDRYDLILEQTFFCALDPSLRGRYVEKMHSLLKPGGKLVGVLFNRDFEGGPPFGGSVEEYTRLFSPYFDLKVIEPCYNSIPQRAGTEVFIIFQKPA